MPSAERRHDLDWLRVLCILLLVAFHAAMPFVADDGWHLKNAERSHLLLEFNFFASRWRMPLLFLIAGAGSAWALGHRDGGAFLGSRLRRLLVPLLLGCFVIVPPQIYFERLAQGAAPGYLAFWATVFRFEPYPAGSFSYHHLWFLAYLLTYTLLALPLMLWGRGAAGHACLARVAARLDGRGVWLLGAAGAVPFVALIDRFPGPQDFVHDWANFGYYLGFFLAGWFLARQPRLWDALVRHRREALRVAGLTFLALCVYRWNRWRPELDAGLARTLYLCLYPACGWFAVLAILGYARRALDRPGRLLAYLSEASYPVYVLHQTVTVVVAYYVLPLAEGVGLKWAWLTAATYAATFLAYETLVRPFGPVRWVFGMGPARAVARPAAAAAARAA